MDFQTKQQNMHLFRDDEFHSKHQPLSGCLQREFFSESGKSLVSVRAGKTAPGTTINCGFWEGIKALQNKAKTESFADHFPNYRC